MKENKKIKYLTAGYAAFLLAAVCGMYWFINEILLDENKWNTNYLIVSTFLYMVILGYSLLKRKELFTCLPAMLFCMACFAASGLLLLLSDFYVNFPLWVAGGIFVAALIDRNFGMLYLYFFAFQAIYLQGSAVNGLILHFLVATAICLVICRMKTWLSMLYVMVFSSSLVVILTLVMNRMDFKQSMMLDSFYISVIYAGCIFLAMLLRLFQKAGSEKTEFAESVEFDVDKLLAPMNTNEDISAAEVRASELALQPEKGNTVKTHPTDTVDTTDYKPYCNENADLMRELKEKKKAVYAHSRLVSKMAGEAAGKIGANAVLVSAAGLYHEIGKLRENAQAAEIAGEHNFPERLVQILKECGTTDVQKLSSREAAVVALTDLILQTYTYLRASGHFGTSAKKIVENAVALCVTKGGMNDSKVTLADLNLLAAYFTEQLTEQDRKKGH